MSALERARAFVDITDRLPADGVVDDPPWRHPDPPLTWADLREVVRLAEQTKAAAWEAVADDLEATLERFPLRGRHTRARWAVEWIRIAARRLHGADGQLDRTEHPPDYRPVAVDRHALSAADLAYLEEPKDAAPVQRVSSAIEAYLWARRERRRTGLGTVYPSLNEWREYRRRNPSTWRGLSS